MSKAVVTFDLWDTVFIDDSDELLRAERGMPSKREARRQLVHEALLESGPIDRAAVDIAYATADAAYNRVWHDHAVTWTVPQRLETILSGLGTSLSATRFAQLVADHEDMELKLPPRLADGIEDALAQLAGRYVLGVVSDTIFSPGRALRQILQDYGLLHYFSAFAFSDEVGCSKPARGMFDAIAAQTGAPLSSIIHIGDRITKDIDGPHAVGALGVLTTVVKQRHETGSDPDGHVDHYQALGPVIDDLASRLEGP